MYIFSWLDFIILLSLSLSLNCFEFWPTLLIFYPLWEGGLVGILKELLKFASYGRCNTEDWTGEDWAPPPPVHGSHTVMTLEAREDKSRITCRRKLMIDDTCCWGSYRGYGVKGHRMRHKQRYLRCRHSLLPTDSFPLYLFCSIHDKCYLSSINWPSYDLRYLTV
jgi:hypothetical protein